jgi:hypothetical protein
MDFIARGTSEQNKKEELVSRVKQLTNSKLSLHTAQAAAKPH